MSVVLASWPGSRTHRMPPPFRFHCLELIIFLSAPFLSSGPCACERRGEAGGQAPLQGPAQHSCPLCCQQLPPGSLPCWSQTRLRCRHPGRERLARIPAPLLSEAAALDCIRSWVLGAGVCLAPDTRPFHEGKVR